MATVTGGGVAAARLGDRPVGATASDDELRIALDGDAVLFDGRSDRFHERHGLEAFLRHEAENERRPMGRGPFAAMVEKLAALRREMLLRRSGRRIRIALVTARSAPAHARALRTLRSWEVEVDEAHFTGGRSKAAILAAYDAHVFFDDLPRHIAEAPPSVTAALVHQTRGSGGEA